MNRYLAIPLSLTLIGFVIVYCSQTNSKEPTLGSLIQGSPTITNTSTTTPAAGTTKPSIKPLALADVKVMILDQWPTLNEFQLGSRMRPSQRMYATLGELAEQSNNLGGGDGMLDPQAEELQSEAADGSSFLCTLRVTSRPQTKSGRSHQSESFPVHVDRFTREAHIFADARWQNYSLWRDDCLPKYQQRTGWNKSQEATIFSLGGDSDSSFGSSPDEEDF